MPLTTDRDAARRFVLLVAAIGVIVATWILVTPTAGGPDEPAHLVRSAGLVRGQVTGNEFPDAMRPGRTVTLFEVPQWLTIPTPCFALDPFQPASCQASVIPSEEPVRLGSSAREYPIWGHVLPGIGTFAPPVVPAIVGTRALSALVPVLLLAATLTVVGPGSMRAASVLLAVTPMAWFTFAVVNPSSMAIAGGVALWAALASFPDARRTFPPGQRTDRAVAWLAAAGWAALVLPRRDGLIWGVAALSIWVVMSGVTFRQLWWSVGRGPRAVVVASTFVTLAWSAAVGGRVTRAQLAVPLVLVVVAGVRAWWRRSATRSGRSVVAVATIAGSIAMVGAVAAVRPGGADVSLATRIVDMTGRHLGEAIGVLGWLDVPLPPTLVFLYLVTLGMLAGVAMSAGRTDLVAGAASVAVVAVGSSWVLEYFSGNTSGTYWQGRYYLPMVVGIPLLFGAARSAVDVDRRVARIVVVVAAIVVNGAFLTASRRWGVGLHRSVWPWDWDTYGAILPPILLAAVHLAAWVVLARLVLTGTVTNAARPSSPA